MNFPLIGLIIFLLGILYYYFTATRKPSLIYQDNPLNNALIKNTKILNHRYYATPWLFNTHAQLIALGVAKRFSRPLVYDRHDTLIMKDGGEVFIEWLGLDLPADRPTMLVLHTISGNSQSMRAFVKYIREKLEWRVALCIRRGHGDTALKTANFNTMGNGDDFSAQIEHVQSNFPHSDLYATGISAGSGCFGSIFRECW